MRTSTRMYLCATRTVFCRIRMNPFHPETANAERCLINGKDLGNIFPTPPFCLRSVPRLFVKGGSDAYPGVCVI